MTIEVPNDTGVYTSTGATLSADANTQTFTALTRNENSYNQKALTVSSGANCRAEGTINITGHSGAGAGSVALTWFDGVGNTQALANGAGLMVASATGIIIPYAYLRQGSAGAAVAFGASSYLTQSTPYYFSSEVLMSLSRYGSVLSLMFTDSGRTTLHGMAVAHRTSAPAYTNFYLAQSTNTGATDTITGYIEDVTLSTPSAGIDLTVATGGHVTTGTNVTAYADCIVVTTLTNNQTKSHSKDYTAGYFAGNFTLKGVLNLTGIFAFATGKRFQLNALTDTLTDHALSTFTGNMLSIMVTALSATTFNLKAREVSGATEYLSAASDTITIPTGGRPIWTILDRTGTAFTLKLYNDPAYLSQIGSTLTLTLHETASFRYLSEVLSWNDGATGTVAFTFGGVSVENLLDGTFAGTAVTTAAFVGAGSASNVLTGTSVATAEFVGASTWSGALAGTSVATADFTGQLFSAGSADMAGTAVVTASFTGASTWSGSLAGAAVTTCNFIADTTPSLVSTITCRISKTNSAGQEVGATGLTPTLKFYQVSNLYHRDFSDNVFKQIASVVTLTANMTELSATYDPGKYYYTLQAYGLGSGAKTEYGYDIDATISATQTYMNEGSMIFLDGIEVLPGLTVSENTTLNKVSATLTNKHVLNPADGTVNVYNDAGTLLYTGLAYSDAAGTVLYNGTAAVHHTTRLT